MSVIVRQACQRLPKSSLQYLSETKGPFQNREVHTKKTAYYVHPIEKRSVSKLSLDLCTESLGTENGSESGEEISLLALEATHIPMIPFTTKPQKESNFMTRDKSFPPPLNSINGFNVRSCKEEGRLVVQAIRVCSPPRRFVSERREGRLCLRLSENSSLNQDGYEDFGTSESEFEAREEDEDGEEEDDAEEEEAEEEGEEGIEENKDNFEGITGKNNFSRWLKSGCFENGCEPKTMHSWKQQQFWVTTKWKTQFS